MSITMTDLPEIKTGLDLTESQSMIRDMVAEFAANEVAPIAAEIDESHRFPTETWKKMVELGIVGIPFSEEMGGGGGDDSVSGGDGADHLHGHDGDDTVSGDAGDDILHGEAGNDVLMGGIGSDHLFGHIGQGIADVDLTAGNVELPPVQA